MSVSTEDYMRSLYFLYEKLDDKSKGIRPVDLAREMGLTKSSISSMSKKLMKLGYIKTKPYSSIFLTRKGMREARRIMHNHRIIEVFLKNVLRYNVSRVHEEANRLEHAFSQESIKRLDRFLRHPHISPEGLEIPKERISRTMTTLDKLSPGQSGIVVNVESSCQVVKRLLAMGLVEGTKVTLKREAPLGDPIEIRLKGYSLSIRKSEARNVVVDVI
ncbi:MAG: DtxR family transcriptional regulator [Deltaproteobacteria bacterium]|nr:DtxR family transcriptional regulator [Deltaproteobacteria bacterium]